MNYELIASIVRELTGDWVTEIDCDDIQKDNRKFYDEVVYFGDKKDLEKDGQANAFITLAKHDTYKYVDHRVAFYVNEDPECRTKFQLEPEKTYIAFLSGEARPNLLTVNEDFISLE